MNCVEGTRQNDSVTSGEGVAFRGKPRLADTKSRTATVYQKHRSLLICKKMYRD